MTWIDRHIDEVFLVWIGALGVLVFARGIYRHRAAFKGFAACLLIWVLFNFLHNIPGLWGTMGTILADLSALVLFWVWHLQRREALALGQVSDEPGWLYVLVVWVLIGRVLWHAGNSALGEPGYAYALGNNLSFILLLAAVTVAGCLRSRRAL